MIEPQAYYGPRYNRRPSIVIAQAAGDGEAEGATLAQPAIDPQAAAMQLDQAFADRQSQPRAADRLPVCAFHLAEMVKDTRQVLSGNADARIADADQHVAILGPDGNGNAAVVGELDGIADDIPQHLP